MNKLPVISSVHNEEIKSLELETEQLEIELSALENSVNAFEHKIRTDLSVQISRLRVLTEKYKELKKRKRAKRIEQKKRGKNYREPLGLRKIKFDGVFGNVLNSVDRTELKRLYKEAIVQIHPDKLLNASDDETKRATSLAAELNALYQTGDLEELNSLHEHILSGNAMMHQTSKPETLADPLAMLRFLKKKRANLLAGIELIKQSALYHALLKNDDHIAFINDLRFQFEQRIGLLEFRTRKYKD